MQIHFIFTTLFLTDILIETCTQTKLPVIKDTENNTKNHMHYTKYNRHFHLHGVEKYQFIFCKLPDLHKILMNTKSKQWQILPDRLQKDKDFHFP